MQLGLDFSPLMDGFFDSNKSLLCTSICIFMLQGVFNKIKF